MYSLWLFVAAHLVGWIIHYKTWQPDNVATINYQNFGKIPNPSEIKYHTYYSLNVLGMLIFCFKNVLLRARLSSVSVC